MMQGAWALLAVLVFVAISRLGAEDVKIIWRDFMFDAPAMLDAGMTTSGFENPGEVRHEMIIVLLRLAVTAQHITEALQSGITLRKVREQFGEGDILGSCSLRPTRAVLGSSSSTWCTEERS